MKLVIIGKSGQGKVVADIAMANNIEISAFLDDNLDLLPDGKVDDFVKYLKEDTSFVIAIGNSKTREEIAKKLEEKGAKFATLIHPSAVISPSAKIGEGSVVMPCAVINAGAVIGKHAIINTSSVVEHDCNVGDFTHISVGAKMGGTCTINNHVWVGIGACISNNISVCTGAYIGAGAVVIKNIEIPGIYVGVPANIMNLK